MNITFENDEQYLPVTNEQFEALVNEMLAEYNKLAAPHFLEPDAMVLAIGNCLHSIDRKECKFSKTALFAGCVNKISMNFTFQIASQAQKRIQSKFDEQNPKPLAAVPDLPVGE